jgi:hypothetical protein
MDKLQKICVKGRMLKWFLNFFTHRFYETSKYEQSRRGLPQGAVTSTTLFNVMISDLPAQPGEIKNCKSAFFADDLVI